MLALETKKEREREGGRERGEGKREGEGERGEGKREGGREGEGKREGGREREGRRMKNDWSSISFTYMYVLF